MILKNKTYDILKLIALVVLPAAGFISALSEIWGFPHGAEVAATLVALDTFLGALIQKIGADYKNADTNMIKERENNVD